MGQWLSLQGLLDLALPGLPGRKAGLRAYVERGRWESRTVSGRGGKRLEYRVPAECLAAGRSQKSDAPAAAAEFAELAAETWRDELQARFHRYSDRKKNQAIEYAMALRVWRGLDDAPEGAARFAERTLRRKWSAVKDYPPAAWAALLVDSRIGRPRERAYSSRIDDLFRADFLRPERPSAAASYDRIKAVCERESLTAPVLKTLMRRLRSELPWQAIRFKRYGAKALDATYPAQERDRSGFRAMQALCADGWRADNLIEWPDGEIGRPLLVSWQDLYSGAIVGWRLDRTENIDLIRLSFGDVLRSYGIPDLVYLDNGHAFAGHWLSGRTPHRFRFKLRAEEPTGIFDLLDITVHWALPHRGQSKPIERAHGEFADRISRHPRMAGSYTGANTVDRPEIRAKHPASLADFLAVVEAEIKSHNERTGRSAKNCHGRSFWQTFKESYARGPVRRATAEQLALALMAVEGVKVSSRDGTFRLAGDNRYYSEAVAQFAGDTIAVRFDPQNLKSQVYCYRLTGELIGAAECIAAVGFDNTQEAREHARTKHQFIKAQKANAERERRLSTRELVELLPQAPAAPELVSSKVVRMMPRLSVAVPAISGAASQGDDPRWRYYRSLKAREPETLDADERAAIRIFEASAEYRIAMRELEVAKAQ